MQGRTILVISVLFLLLLSAVGLSGSSKENPLSEWKPGWSYRQELQLPIETNGSLAHYQPIDLRITFAYPCWTENVNATSVRVCARYHDEWQELDSQIYNLKMAAGDVSHVTECNVVFLVPEFADGTERYFIFYNGEMTPSPTYTNHVSVVDANYSYSPLPDVSATSRFYGITEDGYNIYGVGQEGQILDRSSAQVVVKQKLGAKQFDVLGSDQIVSFAFSYYNGSREKDESSSDQVFLDKKILVDGNLMVSFGVMSESQKGDVRTTVIYKYYYCPQNDKRLNVHVRHEMSKNVTVQGVDNVDGRFGSIISLKARSASVDALNFGVIYPFLNFYGMNSEIETYQMDQNPDTKEREWIISYKDDADLGTQAWLSYGQGDHGVANAVLFASNQGVVISGTDERDGIQLKVAEKQYFNFLGTEVDYASLNFGRNSYQPGYYHDLNIPSNLVVVYDAEVFFSTTGGYTAVQNESYYYQTLVKSRYFSGEGPFEQPVKHYNMTVVTHLGGTHFSYPWLANRTGRNLPVMWIELYRDNNLVAAGAANRSLFIRASRTFVAVPEGRYLIKVFWKAGNHTVFTGAASLTLNGDTKVHVFCTWERVITLTFKNQHEEGIPGIHVALRNKNNVLLDENITQNDGLVTLRAPYNPKDPYMVTAVYKDFMVYEKNLKKSLRKTSLDVTVDLYDLTVEVTDALHLPPGVDLTPTLSATRENRTIQLTPEDHGDGIYFFPDIPAGDYTIQLDYGDTVDQLLVMIPHGDAPVLMNFTAKYSMTIHLFDSTGNAVDRGGISFQVFRDGQMVFQTTSTQFSLPPAHYTIEAYADDQLIGTEDIVLTNSRDITFVTTLSSLFPLFIELLIVLLIGAALVVTATKKFSLPSFLKCLAVVLVVLALFQPWWVFSGSSYAPAAQRTTAMYINPGVMIEKTTYNGGTSFTLAEMPDIFISFLGVMMPVVVLLCVVLLASVLLKKLKKRNYSLLLSLTSVVIVAALLPAFFIGIEKLCETSIGPVQGQGDILVMIQGVEVHLQSTWGFGIGYYLVVLAALSIIGAVVLEVWRLFKMRKQS